MTIDELGTEMLDLVPELRVFAPPAEVIDKPVYSPWIATDLHSRLQARGVNALVITGGETEVCVLAAVMGAIDFGYRVVLAKDAICSSADDTHDAMIDIYCERFQMQVETVDTEAVLRAWNSIGRRCSPGLPSRRPEPSSPAACSCAGTLTPHAPCGRRRALDSPPP